MRRLLPVLAALLLALAPAGALSAAWLTASGMGGSHFREGVVIEPSSTELTGPVGAACGAIDRTASPTPSPV